jgi:hypothetical protein
MARDQLIDDLASCLSRERGNINWPAVVSQLQNPPAFDAIAAVGLDTNALKRLRRDTRAASEVLAYFESEQIPVIIPGQAAQEFWNNHGAVASDLGAVVAEIAKLQKRVNRINSSPEINSKIDAIGRDISGISQDLQDLSNPHILAESLTLWASLIEVADFPFVPRGVFSPIGRDRFDSQTPPGFEDSDKSSNQLGDFFVWADFLFGILESTEATTREGTLILVSDDRKPDWITSERTHPVLIGEALDLTKKQFEIMSTDQLVEKVRS